MTTEQSALDRLEIGLCWGTLQRASLVEMIEAAGRYGFPTLSITPYQVLEAQEAGLDAKALRRKVADAEVRIQVLDALTGALPGTEPGPVTMGGHDFAPVDEQTCFRFAEALGAPILNVTHSRGSHIPLAEMAEAVAGISRRASKHGVQIVLEFIPGTGIATIGEAHAIAQACGEPNCSVLFDTWHLARSGGTVEDVRALPPGAIGALQFSDRTPPPPGAVYVPMTGRDLPGEGQLPLKALIEAALENNPRLTGELEVFSEELRNLTVDAAAARTASAVKAWRAATR